MKNRTQEAGKHHHRRWFVTLSNGISSGSCRKTKSTKFCPHSLSSNSANRIKTLKHIHKRVDQPVPVFVEVNVGEEKSTLGFTIEGLRKALSYIFAHWTKSGRWPFRPFWIICNLLRPYFVRTRIRRRDQSDENRQLPDRTVVDGHEPNHMVAIEEGATLVPPKSVPLRSAGGWPDDLRAVGQSFFFPKRRNMKLTPQDISNQNFASKIKGFDRDEVKNFLMQVVETLENDEGKRGAENTLEKFRENCAKYERREELLRDTCPLPRRNFPAKSSSMPKK